MNDISIKGLSYTYPKGDEAVLSDVSIEVREGEFTVIMGHTGAGKTTLLMCLNGIIPQLLEGDIKGQIEVGGLDVSKYRVQTLSKKLGLVMQDAETQVFGRSVEEDVAFGPRNYLVPREEIFRRVDEALARVRLAGYNKRATHELSGGEKQRLAIAGVLAMQPEILVLDEPTSELDPLGRDEIYRTIADLKNEKRLTIVAVEHSSQEIHERADRVVVLDGGKVVWSGKPADFFRNVSLVNQTGIKPIPVSCLGRRLADRGLIAEAEIPLNVDEAFGVVERLLGGKSLARASAAASESQKKDPSRGEAAPLIRVKDLVHEYGNGKRALDGVTLDINKGDFVALIGQNGAGKTTLAKHFNSILKPSSGLVEVCGVDAGKSEPEDLSRHIGYVFQNPDHQIFCQSVYKELEYGLKNQELGEAETAARIDRVLKLTGLERCRDEHPFSLGKGERQMIAVASILVLEPEILVVDEPTTGLDWRGINRMMDLIHRLHENGTTIVMITHDMDIVARHATRSIVMRQGKVLLDGPTAEVFAQADLLRDAYVTAPEIVRLSARLSALGLDRVLLDEDELSDIVIRTIEEDRNGRVLRG
jgi:energy-coupling factor transport system ATP-binding protein